LATVIKTVLGDAPEIGAWRLSLKHSFRGAGERRSLQLALPYTVVVSLLLLYVALWRQSPATIILPADINH
jgi:hypothetical protein